MAFIAKMQGNPQNTAILISEEGTVRRKEWKKRPPSPNPSPTIAWPMIDLIENRYFLSCSSL